MKISFNTSESEITICGVYEDFTEWKECLKNKLNFLG